MSVAQTYLTENLAELWMIASGFDDLLLTGETVDADGYEYTIRAFGSAPQGGDLSWGTAQPIDVTVQRWMAEGAVTSTQGHDDRTLSFVVKLSAATSVALAVAEAALQLRAESSVLLKWVSMEGADFAPASIFEVWTWHLGHVFVQDDEMRLTRAYQVTMTAKPWTRSETPVTVAATPTSSSATVTSIDACTSATNWTGSPNAPTVAGGTAIRESQTILNPFGGKRLLTARLTRTGSVTGMGTTPYLVLDMGFSPAYQGSYLVTVDGRACTQVGRVGKSVYFKVPSGVTSFTKLVISATANVAGATGGTLVFDVRDVSKTDKVGATTTQKMVNRHMDVGGSVKTSGSIQIASPSAAVLGTCLVYTCPDVGSGYSPPLRQYRTSGGTLTADSTCVSGQREAFVTSGSSAATLDYSIPAGQLQPGTYVVVMRLATSSGPATLNVTVDGTITSIGTSIETLAAPVPVDGSSGFWAVVGAITLPAQARPDESLLDNRIVVLAEAASGSSTHTIDEIFLLDVTHGAFTLVDGNDTGAPITQFPLLWLDSPDNDPVTNLPRIYQGTAADRSDAFQVAYNQIGNLGPHDLDPGGVQVFTVTDSVNDAVVTASFYHRHNTHATD